MKIHYETEESKLLKQLKDLEEDEAEKQRIMKIYEDSNLYYEHFADGDVDLNMLSEAELDMKCDDLFRDTPIPFIIKGKGGENSLNLEKEI